MIIGRGAEAVLKKTRKSLFKKRIKKSYRIKEIDSKLRSDRTKKETNLLVEARRHGVRVPQIMAKDLETATIEMEHIEGPVLRDKLNRLSEKNRKLVCIQIGKMVADLHLANIIHGDLTTSNMIVKDNRIEQLYFIDFGLGFFSQKIEDKAVDLHLLKRALISKHNKIWKDCYRTVFKTYSKELGKEKSKKIKERIERIEQRGRYMR